MRKLTSILLVAAGALPASAEPLDDRDFWMRADVDAQTRDAQVTGWDAARGQPTVVWFPKTPAPGWVSSPEAAAWQHLSREAQRWGLDVEDLARLSPVEVHDVGRGAIIVRYQAHVDGLPVFRDQLAIAMDQRLRLVGITGSMTPLLAEGTASAFELDPQSALGAALVDATQDPWFRTEPVELRGEWTWFQGEGASARLGEGTRARAVRYPGPRGLRPAYHIELMLDGVGRNEAYGYVIDAADGAVLFRMSLMADHDYTYRVYALTDQTPSDGPNGDAEIPDRSGTPATPPRDFSASGLVTLDHGPISTGDPWMSAGSNETRGNNVDAYVDIAAPDGFQPANGDFRAPTTSLDTFDYIYDTNTNASANDTQRNASIVHAFYTLNWLHDDFYDNGFDETAGNAQQNNYGRGGIEGDDLRLEIHDYSGRNNANMLTPSDGNRPRMQMYLWNEIDRTAARDLTASNDYATRDARFGPRDFDVTAEVVVALDAGVTDDDACDPPFSNASSISGRIALAFSGGCSAADKVSNLQAAGAAAVLIADADDSIDRLTGSASGLAIGALAIGRSDALSLDSALAAGPVEMRVQRDEGEEIDSGLDTLVLAHEWGHYISNRLIQNSSGLFNNMGRSMGEGWADFHGLLTSIREEDAVVPANARWLGAFAGSNTVAFRGPYFGIRRVPYSIDFDKNGLTYRHIQDNEPLPADVPTAFGQNGSINNMVHRSGEVWGTMLWEGYAALILDPTYTFEQARERMQDYLVGGYKLTPAAPTYVEARDGILLAAFARDLRDFETLWRAFGRRGIGVGAVSPSRFSSSHRPVTESFDVGASAALSNSELDDEVFWCDREGVLDSGEEGAVALTVTNDGAFSMSAPVLDVRALSPGLSFPNGSTFSLPALGPFASVTTTVTVALTGLTSIETAEIAFDVTDSALIGRTTRTSTRSWRVNYDEVANASTSDDAETDIQAWTFPKQISVSTGFARVALDATNNGWRGRHDSFGQPNDAFMVSPELVVDANADLTMVFRHRYDIEQTWDGAVVEITSDAGTTWTDVSQFTSIPYDAPLRSNTGASLASEPAFNGRNPSYPAFDVLTLDFGQTFAGQTVQIRFRIASDHFVRGQGWDIDDVVFTGITNTPFPQAVPDRGICVNRPPLVLNAADQVVFEGETVVLTERSTDPDGDSLTTDWMQVAGATVALAGDTFVAPEVDADTFLDFSFTVADGEFSRGPGAARVLVRDRNKRPRDLIVEGPSTAPTRAEVTYTVRAVDPDMTGPLTFEWVQLSGPGVMLSDVAELTFMTPDVTEESVVSLQVVANDGVNLSAPERVDLTVRPENRAPVDLVLPNVTLDEGARGTLQARASDPDGDDLAYTFRALDTGLESFEVVGDRARFRAPSVDSDAVFRVEVTATDGAETVGPVVAQVQVRDVPLIGPPVLDLPAPEPEPDTGSDDPATGGLADGGGCSSTGPLPSMWALLGGLIMMRRRRRRLP